MAATESLVRDAARVSSESVTPIKKRIIARAARPGGKVLADRGLSRLLGKDWPRTLDELEALKRR